MMGNIAKCLAFFVLTTGISISGFEPGAAQEIGSNSDRRNPTVGASGRISQIVLPGSELEGIPIDPDSPLVVRVLKSFPHGDSFRYDIQFLGMEPGEYDLADWLQRKDGSDRGELPVISVQVESLLPPGQIEPNPLAEGLLPRLGGYSFVAIVAVLFWFAILFCLIFLGRRKPPLVEAEQSPTTFAQLLRPRLEAAVRNEIRPEQYAELERMLFAFWRKRLDLESQPADSAMMEIKNDQTAGPLMRQLESWMHDPKSGRDVELANLLKPYENIPVEAIESPS